jgi:uncharacterized protein (TIGR03437 family)
MNQMSRIRKTLSVIAFCALGSWNTAQAQGTPSPVILQVDVENIVNYVDDVSDPSKLATAGSVTTATTPLNFYTGLTLGDIVAVNGQSAKGAFVGHSRQINLRPSPTPGQAVSDVTRTVAADQFFEILRGDGTPVGSIMITALAGTGPAPPGAPLAVNQGNNAIVGGTGAYLGARGQAGQAMTAQTVANRVASMSEDPANRRKGVGGKSRFLLTFIPMFVPQIVVTATGPAVVHATDFAMVTAARPAQAGEILTLFATGLGPTQPGVDPGQPFPSSPPLVVNSPVLVTVNGSPAQVLAAVSYPGSVDGYQVNFQVPPGTVSGMATIQVSAAWIPGPVVSIPVR